MSAADEYYFINNRIVPAAEAAVLSNDLGLYRGYGVFDYFRTHDGEPLLMQEYLQRFRSSAAELHLNLRMEDEALESIIRELIDLNKKSESGVRLLLTGGYSENMFKPGEPNLLIRIEQSVMPPESVYTKGVKLLSNEYLREMAGVKTTNYLNAIRLWPEVEAAGATELLYHWGGEWLECSRSNFFVVAEGVLLTPPSSKVLAGITRGRIIALARQAGIRVEERSLPLNIIREAEEAFISGTTKRVMPVVRIDQQQIGDGKPGPLSRELLNAWMEMEAEHTAHSHS